MSPFQYIVYPGGGGSERSSFAVDDDLHGPAGAVIKYSDPAKDQQGSEKQGIAPFLSFFLHTIILIQESILWEPDSGPYLKRFIQIVICLKQNREKERIYY